MSEAANDQEFARLAGCRFLESMDVNLQVKQIFEKVKLHYPQNVAFRFEMNMDIPEALGDPC